MISSLRENGVEAKSVYDGHSTIKQIFDANAILFQDKPFFGTREKSIDANGAVTFGEYKWKTYGSVHSDAYAIASYL